ncbi:hypothetical protein ACFWPU_00745 [Streptomyces sp. NPDC058471]|uniref:hypothetical protein n=1 Tax=Streptomyces sp. NPDC058471 TaxID=3346516 RepID=UPI003663B8AB
MTQKQRLERLRVANDRLVEARDALIEGAGEAGLVDAYKDALAERLRAEYVFWAHQDADHKAVMTIAEWAALEVERAIKTGLS